MTAAGAVPGGRVVALIAGMSLVTVATKVGGFWLLDRVEVGPRARAALETLPGALVVSVVGVELLRGGPAEWAAGAVVLGVAARTDSVLAALAAGVLAVLAFRAVL